MKVTRHIERCDEEYICGWAFAPEQPKARVQLDILYRDKLIGSCVAEVMREDLAAAGLSDGCCAFTFKMPVFPKGQMNHISVIVADTGEVIARGKATLANESETFRPFGGMWIDRPDFLTQLAHKKSAGTISEELSLQLSRFVLDGYVIFKNAVPAELIDQLNEEIEGFWRDPPQGMVMETYEPDRQLKHIPPRLEYRGRDEAAGLVCIFRSCSGGNDGSEGHGVPIGGFRG